MGFFDRFLSKSSPAESPPAPAEPTASGGGVLPQLVAARERLEVAGGRLREAFGEA